MKNILRSFLVVAVVLVAFIVYRRTNVPAPPPSEQVSLPKGKTLADIPPSAPTAVPVAHAHSTAVSSQSSRQTESFDFSPTEDGPNSAKLPFLQNYLSLRANEMADANSEYVQATYQKLAEMRTRRLAAEGIEIPR